MNASFDSYSQNGEDVVLARALDGVAHGRYIDVGANDPAHDSVSMAFYAMDWSGITVEPDPSFARLQREQRPRDLLIEAAATDRDGDEVTLHVVDGTGLSTLSDQIASAHAGTGRPMHDVSVRTRRLDRILSEAGWEGQDIHFMSVDTEGSERDVLAGVDLKRWRPWILVVEATKPNSTESTREAWEDLVLWAGYQFCLFDGLSCFYVADEHEAALRPALSYPACALDNFTTWALREALTERDDLKHLYGEVVAWRNQALSRWFDAVSNELLVDQLRTEIAHLRMHEANLLAERQVLLDAIQHLEVRIDELTASTSWRITRPLRSSSGALATLRHRR